MPTNGLVRVTGCVPLIALLGLLGAGAAGTALSACVRGDECSEKDSQCHDNVLWTCYRSDEDLPRWVWRKQDCGAGFCRQAVAGTAFCAVEATANPACLGTPPVTLDGIRCTAEGRLVGCSGGYIDTVYDTCARPELCIPSAGACTLSAAVDARCQATAKGSTEARLHLCDSQHLLSCSFGYLIGDLDCGPGTCYRPEPQFRIECVLSATPDPRCMALPDDPVGHAKQGCDGDLQFTCYDNYIESLNMCAPGHCVVGDGPNSAYCDM
jgi:hypothetical protein